MIIVFSSSILSSTCIGCSCSSLSWEDTSDSSSRIAVGRWYFAGMGWPRCSRQAVRVKEHATCSLHCGRSGAKTQSVVEVPAACTGHGGCKYFGRVGSGVGGSHELVGTHFSVRSPGMRLDLMHTERRRPGVGCRFSGLGRRCRRHMPTESRLVRRGT